MEVIITNAAVLSYWGAVKSTVWISDERFGHIRDHHLDDYGFYSRYIATAIQSPFLILADYKNVRTAMFVGRTEREGINVIVKLARAEDEDDRSFVVTMHPIGPKRLHRLAKANPIIDGSELPFSDDGLDDQPE